MKSKILNKLSKEGREKIIMMEGKLRELDFEIEGINRELEEIENKK